MLEPYALQDGAVLLRFGRFDEVLALKAPGATRTVQTALYAFMRGAAYAGQGKVADAARGAAGADGGHGASGRGRDDERDQPGPGPVRRGDGDLEGRIASARGDQAATVTAFTSAVAAEDRLNYNEPPDWLLVERERLGAALLAQGRAPDAEQVFRADLYATSATRVRCSGCGKAWRRRRSRTRQRPDAHSRPVCGRRRVTGPGPVRDERGDRDQRRGGQCGEAASGVSSLYLAFLAVTAVFVVTPGSTTAVVVRNTLAGGHRAGLSAALGAAVANSTHATLAGLGLWVLVGRWPALLDAIRAAGAAYLAWLGLQSLMRALRARPSRTVAQSDAVPPLEHRSSFIEGITVNLLNPAIISFYVAVVPTFMPPSPPRGYFALLAASHVSMALICHSGWASRLPHTEADLREAWCPAHAGTADRRRHVVAVVAGAEPALAWPEVSLVFTL